jgi:type IVB pilus formation R64 PilN family outer membrane protein
MAAKTGTEYMKTPSLKTIGFTLVSALALSACSSDLGTPGSREGTSAQIDAMEAQINEDSSLLTNATETGRPSNIRVRDGLYLGEDGFRTGRGSPLPRRFETDDGVSMHVSEEISVFEFAPKLRQLTGLRVDYRDIAFTPQAFTPGSGSAESTDGAASAGSTADSTSTTAPEGMSSQDMDSGVHPADVNFRVDYTGPLSGLLDYVASQIGADWEYRGGRIKFLGAQTVTYTVWALPGTTSTSASIGGGGSSDIFGGASPATTERSIESDYWADLSTGLESILPEGAGARYTLNQANGTITVTAYQNIHERVSDFIAAENARLSRQVAVKVDVLAFTAESTDSRSTEIEGIMQNLAWGLGADISTASNAIEDGVSLGTTILENDKNIAENLVGTNAVISALATQGKVSLLDSVSVLAMNNAATPISIMKERAYLAGTTTTVDDDGTETTEAETGLINSGINMVVTPRILSGGEVNLDYTMNLSNLTSLESFESDTVTVQLPEIETRNFMQSVNMDSGATMVIAAYDSQRNTREASGPFDPSYWGLGGSDSYETENTKIMVLMSPVVIEKQNTPDARR